MVACSLSACIHNLPRALSDDAVDNLSDTSDGESIRITAATLPDVVGADTVIEVQPAYAYIVIPPPPAVRAVPITGILDIVAVLMYAPVWANLILRARRQFEASVARRPWWRNEFERLEDAHQEIYLHAVGNRMDLNLPSLEPEFGLYCLLHEESVLIIYLDMIHPANAMYLVMGTAERPHSAILQYVCLLFHSCRRSHQPRA